MAREQYDEFPLKVGEIQFLFFIDGGFYQSEGYFSTPHLHSFTELIYVARGKVCVKVSNKEILLEEGSLLALPRETEHEVRALSGASFTFLAFWDEANFIEELCHISPFPVGDVFLRLLDYYYGNSVYKYELICACLTEICVHLIQAVHAPEIASRPLMEGQKTRHYTIEYYIRSNYKNAPSLSALAKSLHLSLSQTDRTVRQIYGMSFSEKVRALRMEEAKSLLTTTTLPVAKIALNLGYANAHNFHTAFKKETGITPGEYRRQAKNNSRQL
ncbi:MAG: helix-turn-helix transcriptional regulator [Clostridia bacterium]|nr:helix-turn-helix transcriptional regulator [Clostridia bacterium]